jgi:hypothetical protein
MKRVSLKTLATIFVSAFLMVVVAKPLVAQVAPKPQSELDEKQLRSFARVYVQVEKIRQEYEPRAKEASGPEEGKQIQQEAQSKFQQVLTKEGLSEESYVQIFEVARTDQDLRKKILQMIGEEKAKS